MKITKVKTVESTLSTKDHPYMQGAWETFYDEFNAINLQSIGEIPEDIGGIYIRNTENQVHEPIGRFHPFDGDGMLHSIIFENGKADYRNRFIQTEGFQVEEKFHLSGLV